MPVPKSTFTTRYRLLTSLLVDARIASGLTQSEIAERLGRPQSFVSKYERGERRLDLIEFLDLADILQIDVAAFLLRITRKRRRS